MNGARQGSLVVLLAALITACSASGPTQTNAGYDASKAKAEAATFVTYAMPGSWANYGEQFTRFCQAKFGFDCDRPERSQGEDLTSAEEIAKFDAEKNNPIAILSDVALMYAPQAEKAQVLTDYLPPNASALTTGFKGSHGGWIAVYVAVPAFFVNLTFLGERNIPVPRTWRELTNPIYRGMIGMSKVGSSGPATAAVVAMNLAVGGTLGDYTKGIPFFKQLVPNLTQQMTTATFEKGEVPIAIRYDMSVIQLAAAEKAKGIQTEVIVPADGSIYVPYGLIMNRYDTAHSDFGKMFMEWVLSDEGQTIFAKSGAHPIRAVEGADRLVLPDSARANWLPDAAYVNVRTLDVTDINPAVIGDMWQNQVLSQ